MQYFKYKFELLITSCEIVCKKFNVLKYVEFRFMNL